VQHHRSSVAKEWACGIRRSRHWLGALLGDLLVRLPSASGQGNGRGRSIPFEVDNGHELSDLNHFDLLNHPAVYEQLRAWLSRGQGGLRGQGRPLDMAG
jgi:hypothetical protein